MKKITEEATVVTLLPAAEYSGAANATGVDLAGEGRRLMVSLNCGAIAAAGTAEVVIQEDDAVGFGTASTLHAFDTIDTDTFSVAVDLLPTKRYIRARVTGVSATAMLSIAGVIYGERYKPSNVASL